MKPQFNNKGYVSPFPKNTTNPQSDTFDTYHLSTSGYYFKYRPDAYNEDITRARLYDSVTKKELTSVRVENKTHADIINHFEVFVQRNKKVNMTMKGKKHR